MSADSIQTQLDRLKAGDTLKLDPPRNEFQGPLVIRKAVVIEGQGGTIWSARGPVVSIESPGVVLHDVNLEITSRDGNLAGEGSCALMVAQSVKTSLNNVTVRGNVVGLNSEEGNWNCPRAIALGTIKAGMPHEFKVLLSVPVPCALESEIDGLRLAPKTIQGDPVTVTLSLDPLPNGTRLRGQIKLRTALLVRKIALSGNVSDAATVIGNGQVLWKPGGEPMAPPRPLIVDDGAPAPAQPARAPTGLAQPARSPATGAPHPSLIPQPISPEPLPAELRTQSSVPAGTPIIVVSKFDEGQFQTISEAIRHARTGTRILVRPGLYKETIVLDKKLEIIGDGPVAEIIVESPDSNCLALQTDIAKVRGLTFRGEAAKSARERYTVNVTHGQPILEDCVITSDSLACVAIHGSTASPMIRKCKIHSGKSAGVLVFDRGEGEIEDCDIFDVAQAGIEIQGAGNPIVRRCRIHDVQQVGALIHETGKGTFQDCEIFNTALACVEIASNSSPVLKQCKIHNGRYPGIRVHANGQGTIEDCDIYDQVLAGIEIKDGGNPVLRRCKVHDCKQAGVLFTKNAQGSLEECDIYGNGLAGVEIRQGASPVLRRCKVHDCNEVGVLVREKGKGTLEDCEIFDTTLSAVEVRQGGSPVLRRCKIHDSKLGGVLVVEKSAVTLEDSDIFSNRGSGVAIAGESNAIVRHCKVRDSQQAGVVVWEDSKATVEKCDIFANALAGVTIAQGSSPIVRYCKITRNGDVAVWVHQRGAGAVEECDLTLNQHGELDMDSDSNVRLTRNKLDPA